MLQTSIERIELPLETPFTISRGTSETVETIVVRLDDGEHVGIGAAAPASRYDESPESVEAILPSLLSIVEENGDPHALDRIAHDMREHAPDEAAARASVSIALHDLVGKRVGLPLYRYLGLDPLEAPRSSYTIGLDEPSRMAEKAAAAVQSGFEILKVKLDEDRPVLRVGAVREVDPAVTIRVDVNEAWNVADALEHLEGISQYDVEFVEQPVSAGDDAGLARIHEASPIPIAVDESCLVASDVPSLADKADIVVVKLMKCGGMREARRIAAVASAHGLESMLGCMVGSNASITAGCHLAPAFDYADLDGSLLLADDPFDGILHSDGRIELESSDPGTGARRR